MSIVLSSCALNLNCTISIVGWTSLSVSLDPQNQFVLEEREHLVQVVYEISNGNTFISLPAHHIVRLRIEMSIQEIHSAN